jgi:hypothetical protein
MTLLADLTTDFATVTDDLVAFTLTLPTDLQTGLTSTGITTPPTAGLFEPAGTLNSQTLYFCPDNAQYIYMDLEGGWSMSTDTRDSGTFGHKPYWENGSMSTPIGSYNFFNGAGSIGTPVVAVTPVTSSITHAAAQSVSTKEAAESFGRYQLGDKHFTWPISEGVPQLGGSLTDTAGESWIILDVNYESLMALYRVTARNLAITGGLNELITIQRRTIAKGTEGAAESTWGTYQSNVRARIQEQRSDRSEQLGKQSGVVSAKCYLAQELLLDNTYRIVRADSTVYEVEGYESPDSIGSLTVINCMRRL